MARSTPEIQNEMLVAISSSEVLSTQLTSTSKAAIFRLFTFIVAEAISLLELIFDQHKKEIDTKLANQKTCTLPWYRDMALKFQYGFDLVEDQDYFDNTGATAEQIEDSKIVKYSAVDEATEDSRVIIKIAGETNNVLSPITPEEKEAFDEYIKEIRVAGVKVTVINYLPDKLFLNIQIQRDALVLDATGMSILYATYPVNDAIMAFMKELPFNGQLKLSALVDKLQLLDGVLDATVLSAESAWLNPTTGGYDNPQPIFISKIPVSGYFEVANFDNIHYVV